jgi:hypothetical protein
MTLPSAEQRLSDEEYMSRLRAHFRKRGGDGADEVADGVTIEEWREGFDNDPEGAAEEEMSYWAEDGHE